MKPKRTRKLGKSQERRLHAALSTDDLLYRKFDHLNRQLQEVHERLIARPQRVVRVLGLRNDGLTEALQIVSVGVSPEGTCVLVRLPPDSPKQTKIKNEPPKEAPSQDTIKPPPGFSMGNMKNGW